MRSKREVEKEIKEFIAREKYREKAEARRKKRVIQQDPLRPDRWNKFVGQERVKKLLQTTIQSAKIRKAACDHILLSSYGPGRGKSTIAYIIAKELQANLVAATAANLSTPLEMGTLLSDLNASYPAVLFIDEIHRLKPALTELLHSPMEEGRGQIATCNSSGKEVLMEVAFKPFTLIGATAGDEGILPKPLLDRFGLKLRLDPYSLADIEEIIRRSAKILGIEIDTVCIQEIAVRSGFTPRVANNFLKRVRDKSIVENRPVSLNLVKGVFEELQIDEKGLDGTARKILQTICEAKRGTIGLNTLARLTGISEFTIKNCYEPLLVTNHLIEFTPLGRHITEAGSIHIYGERRSQNIFAPGLDAQLLLRLAESHGKEQILDQLLSAGVMKVFAYLRAPKLIKRFVDEYNKRTRREKILLIEEEFPVKDLISCAKILTAEPELLENFKNKSRSVRKQLSQKETISSIISVIKKLQRTCLKVPKITTPPEIKATKFYSLPPKTKREVTEILLSS